MTEPVKNSDPGGSSTGKKKRASPGRLTLPRGVLLRVDVLHDGAGRIRVDTRERLTLGWSDERKEVASLLLKTGVDVLEGFLEGSETGGRKNARSSPPQVSSDLQRLYG